MFRRTAWLGALWGLTLGCNQAEPKFVLDCSALAIPEEEGLTLEAARRAHLQAEQRRDLRYREALRPGYLLRETRERVSQRKIDRGQVCHQELAEVGRLLFEHEYSFADGLGRQDARSRPDPFRRVHEGHLGGPETNSCTSCHWRGGPAGAGAVQDNAQLFGDGVNTSTAIERNPPALQGSGVVQALAQEMSRELQGQANEGIARLRDANKEGSVLLQSKGISFGELRVLTNGQVDDSGLKGIDRDLQIKPFGWRGDFGTLRQFIVTSTQVHLGIQSEDLLAMTPSADRATHLGKGPKGDPDNDGMIDELSAGQLTSLVLYVASLPLPVIRSPKLHEFPTTAEGMRSPAAHDFYDRYSEGQRLFENTGCSLCHTPMLVLSDPVFRTTSAVTGKTYEVDLSREGARPRLQYDSALGGYPVWLFSDMKRHELGEKNSYLSRRLWGLADSPPYFYDGRAPTLDVAIEAHGGEAGFARQEFSELTDAEKGSLRIFLLSLKRQPELIVP